MSRITIDPAKLDGAPCIKGVSVTEVVRSVVDGTTVESILKEYPGLEEDDLHCALYFAANAVSRGTGLDEMVGHRLIFKGKSAALLFFGFGILVGLLLSRVIW